jgi:glutathionylspermidine synthase
MLAPLLKEFDDRIMRSAELNESLFERLTELQRELGLVFGDRPTCPFLRPHIITRTQYDEVARAARIIAVAIEKMVARALNDDELLMQLDLTPREAAMARIDPGYSRLCVTSRLDAYVSDDGFKFLEYNAESPAGVGDQMQLEKVLFGMAHMKQLLGERAHWRPEPHKRLLQSLLQAYRECGGDKDYPNIAIVDWKGVSTESEFRILQKYFAAEGCPTIIADPNELKYSDGKLRVGDFAIDIVYKRVVIHEFLERCSEDHPLAQAYADGRVCMANSFRTKLAHKKAGFAVLSDPRFAHLFSGEEAEAIRRHIPWTRRVIRGTTSFEGAAHDMIQLIRSEREQFVLKPNDDYGGHGVFLGWETSADDWEQATALALERPYVVQQRVPLKKVPMPTFSGGLRLDEMYVDFNPFLFHNEVEGALIRLSSSSLLNVTSGGGQTALLVLEDM